MSKIPFSIYDFFGYLASGYLLIATVDHVIPEELIFKDEMGAAYTIFWLFAAYVTGHVIAHLASWVLEGNLVGRGLKRPNEVLFELEHPKAKKWVFPLPGFPKASTFSRRSRKPPSHKMLTC